MSPSYLFRTWLACLGTLAIPAMAQGLIDPTQPPAALDSMGSAGADAAPSGLQTIIRRAGARPGALISGQYVELGGMVGEARLVKVGEDRVELQGPAGREVMFLTPSIEKKVPASAVSGKGGKAVRAATKDRAGR